MSSPLAIYQIVDYMRCFGLTKQVKRCKKVQKWPFCRQHRFQPVALLFSLLGVVAMFGGLFQDVIKPLSDSMFTSLHKGNINRPELEASLPLMIGGFWLGVGNRGTSVAQGVHAEIVSWGNGAPEANIQVSKNLPDMPPGYDTRFHLDLFDHGTYTYTKNGKIIAASSGYIVLTCSNCDQPRSWAFFLPQEGSELWDMTSEYTGLDSSWPLVEFDFATQRPKIGSTVNYLWRVNEGGWFPPQKSKSIRE